eukprot:2553011-Pyramimonas_sp.AAC.1
MQQAGPASHSGRQFRYSFEQSLMHYTLGEQAARLGARQPEQAVEQTSAEPQEIQDRQRATD